MPDNSWPSSKVWKYGKNKYSFVECTQISTVSEICNHYSLGYFEIPLLQVNFFYPSSPPPPNKNKYLKKVGNFLKHFYTKNQLYKIFTAEFSLKYFLKFITF